MKPDNAIYNPSRGTSTLIFNQDGDFPKHEEYYIRGGICWPMSYKEGGEIKSSGFIILGGVNCATGKIVIFEQTNFVTVNPFVRDNIIENNGVIRWFNDNWNKYFSNTYYWNQSKELNKKFRADIRRSEMIQPKPMFKRVSWGNDEDALHRLWVHIKSGKNNTYFGKKVDDNGNPTVLYQKISDLHKGEKDIHPAIRALMCLIIGFDSFPWIKPKERPEPEVVWMQ